MPSPTDPSERIAEVLREILFLTTDMSPAASEAKKEKDSEATPSEQEKEPKS